MGRTHDEIIAEAFGDGDWISGGALRDAWVASRPNLDVDTSIAQLARLYPPHVVLSSLKNPASGLRRLVSPLMIGGWHIQSGALLQLGLDLALCDGWERQQQLVKRLQGGREYDGARFEVGLWAGGRRTGLDVRYLEAKKRKDCDLEYRDGGEVVRVEAKAVHSSERYRRARQIEAATQLASDVCGDRVDAIGGVEMVIHLSAAVHSWLESGCGDVGEGLDVVGQRFAAWVLDRCHPLALDATTGEVDGLGRVQFRRGMNHRGVSIQVDTPPEYDWDSVLRPLRLAPNARDQLMAGDASLRVAAFWSGVAVSPARLAAEYAAVEVVRNPDNFAGIDCLVFLNSHTIFGDWRTFVAPVAVAPMHAAPVNARWLQAMKAWHCNC
jgi:hypothetical protein